MNVEMVFVDEGANPGKSQINFQKAQMKMRKMAEGTANVLP